MELGEMNYSLISVENSTDVYSACLMISVIFVEPVR